VESLVDSASRIPRWRAHGAGVLKTNAYTVGGPGPDDGGPRCLGPTTCPNEVEQVQPEQHQITAKRKPVVEPALDPAHAGSGSEPPGTGREFSPIVRAYADTFW